MMNREREYRMFDGTGFLNAWILVTIWGLVGWKQPTAVGKLPGVMRQYTNQIPFSLIYCLPPVLFHTHKAHSNHRNCINYGHTSGMFQRPLTPDTYANASRNLLGW